jgi:hypothetical protein
VLFQVVVNSTSTIITIAQHLELQSEWYSRPPRNTRYHLYDFLYAVIPLCRSQPHHCQHSRIPLPDPCGLIVCPLLFCPLCSSFDTLKSLGS